MPSTLKQHKMHCKRCHIKFISEENICFILLLSQNTWTSLLCQSIFATSSVEKLWGFFLTVCLQSSDFVGVYTQYILYENRKRWAKLCWGVCVCVCVKDFLLVSKYIWFRSQFWEYTPEFLHAKKQGEGDLNKKQFKKNVHKSLNPLLQRKAKFF